MKRKIISTILLVLLISLTIILGSARKVPAKPPKVGCSNSSLQGSYGLHATGINAAGAPIAVVGVFSFDGAGSLTGTLFLRLPGTTIPNISVSGIYTVNSDCTVSDTWGDSGHESVIVDGGRGYLILNTTDGVISGEAHKLFPGNSE